MKVVKVGICGLGFVGKAIRAFMESRHEIEVYAYDKYHGDAPIAPLFNCEVIFLCLPTLFHEGEYDMSAVDDTLTLLKAQQYTGLIFLKSTVAPDYCRSRAADGLNLIHNPEFLTARTASADFAGQIHIVLGYADLKGEQIQKVEQVEQFYKPLFPEAHMSHVLYESAALMKLACNAFYATKVQFFSELYLVCQEMEIPYEEVKHLMLQNKWINSQHTQVPGPDGQISFGGACLPKDTRALHAFLAKKSLPCELLAAVIKENNKMRN